MSNYIVLSEYEDGNPVHIKKSHVSLVLVKSEIDTVFNAVRSFFMLPFKSVEFTLVVVDGSYIRVLETPAEIARLLR